MNHFLRLIPAAALLCCSHLLHADLAAWVKDGHDSALSTVPSPCIEIRRQDWGEFRTNQTIWNTPLQLGDRRYSRGLHTHAASELVLHLPAPATRFLADVGVDHNPDTLGTKGSCDFAVSASGKPLWHSGTRRSSDAPAHVDLPLDNATELTLDTTDAGDGYAYDQADWADARVELQGGATLWLDTLPVTSSPAVVQAAPVPFSMTIAGHPATHWQRTSEGRYLDPSGIEVTVQTRTFPNTDAVDYVLHLRNTSDKPSPRIESVRPLDLDLKLPGYGDPTFRSVKGSTCAPDDFLPITSTLEVNRPLDLAPAGGRSSNGTFPMWNVDFMGGGLTVAVGWSGQWSARLLRTPDRHLRLTAGQQDCSFILAPHEQIRTPRILLFAWQGNDPAVGQSQFRRLLLDHYVPHQDGKPVTVPLAEFQGWYHDNYNGINESNQLADLRRAADLGADAFWMDTAWFPGGWPTGVGNWDFDPKKFPGGLGVIGDECHRRNLKFILWFEPERVARNSALAKAQPNAMLSAPGAGDFLYNLGDPAARHYLEDLLADRITRFHVDTLRIDFNIDPLPYWRAADAADKDHVGLTESRYVAGLYELWDHLRARFPNLIIDNCASGGRRIDLETLSRSIPLWRSDTACEIKCQPEWGQVQTAGLSQYAPINGTGVWSHDPYTFRSWATTGVNDQTDTSDPAFDADQARAAFAETRSLRDLWLGDFFPLIPATLDPTAWCGWQCDRPDLGRGFVMLFRHANSPYPTLDLHLRNLDPAATYELDSRPTFAKSTTTTLTGQDLSHFRATIPTPRESLLLTYRKLDRPK